MKAIVAAACVLLPAALAAAQPRPCPPAGWNANTLRALKLDEFKLDEAERRALALALPACLGHHDPEIRDGIAFEALSAWMRAGRLDQPTLVSLRDQLLDGLSQPDPEGFRAPFSALVLAEVARTDRIKPWMTPSDRDLMVRAAASFLAHVRDYRAYDDREGFRHAVAHGADLVLQLALNPAVSKSQLDQLLPPIASQVAPETNVAYWAGEPDRLARPVIFIAQRTLHTEAEWKAFFAEVTDPTPLSSWTAAFTSEAGIRKRHNVRAFLLSVYASATASDDAGVRALVGPAAAALKTVP